MRTLVVTDKPQDREAIGRLLAGLGYETESAGDAATAVALLNQDDGPKIVLIDARDGRIEVVQNLRSQCRTIPVHIIALVATPEETSGELTGADDYLSLPLKPNMVAIRLQLGEKVLTLEVTTSRQLKDLEAANRQVAQLQGFIPICAWCKKIRDDSQFWQEIDDYLQLHCDTAFTHSICPSCMSKKFSEILDGTR